MKRTAGVLVLLAALGGCVSTDRLPGAGVGCGSFGGWASGPPTVPGVQGPWGQPVTMAAPYSASPPRGAEAARAMMAQSIPMDSYQAAASAHSGASSGIMQVGGQVSQAPPGSISPPAMAFQPFAPGMTPPPGAVAAVGALTGPSALRFPTRRTEVRFVGPTGMKISWFSSAANGQPGMVSSYLVAPNRYNFVQAAVYRLKLTDIPGRPGVALYPTLEVVPANAKTEPFLAHSAVPVNFTDRDFDQVAAGHYLVKVIYLPDPPFQDLATTGPEELVFTELDPGVDPIAEAHRRGNILLVVRMGNINLELATSPALDAPSPYMPMPVEAPGMPGHGMLPAQPMMHSPNGPFMGAPAMQPGPISRLPDISTVQPTQDGQAGEIVTPVEVQPVEKKPARHHWWWPGSSSDK